jgi:hypothetical protein
MFLECSSWQERYLCDEIYTLRCRIMDKPGMLGRVITVIGECGGHVGDVHFADLCEETKSRDITVFCSSDQLKTIMNGVNNIDGAEVESVRDEVF